MAVSRMRRLFRLATGRLTAREELADELALHIELRTEELIAEGLDPVTAKRRAVALFGDRRGIEEECMRVSTERWRSGRRSEWLAGVGQDLGYLRRSFARSPRFFLTLITTLALGIALNAVILSVVDALLIRPLPFAAPEELVELGTMEEGGYSRPDIPAEAVPVWAGQPAIFRQIEFYDRRNVEYTGGDEPETVHPTWVSPGMFAMLGARAALGRTLVESDISPGAPRVVVISDNFWREKFGAASDALGRTITLDGERYTVVGVMPRGFTFHVSVPSLWVPLDKAAQPSLKWVSVVGRLRPLLPVAEAQAHALALAPGLQAERPLTAGWKIQVSALGGTRANPDTRAALWMLVAGVGCVLLIGCTNAANLLLVRGTVRQHELAIRQALGAGRMRLFRQALTESVCIAAVSGALGAALASLLLDALVPLIPLNVTFMAFHAIRLDGRILLAMIGLTLAAGIGFGLLPALQASRRELHIGGNIGANRATSSRGAGAIRSALLVAQLAFAVLLLGGGGLLLHSFVKLSRVEPGLDVDRLAIMALQLSDRRYTDSTASHFDERLLERLRHVPGVSGAALAHGLPPSSSFSFGVKPQAEGRDAIPWGDFDLLPSAQVDSAYFRVAGTRLLAGRGFHAADQGSAERPVVIDQPFAVRLFGAEAPLGRRFRTDADGSWLTVVGIAEPAKLGGPDGSRGEYAIYYPASRIEFGYRQFLVRTERDPEAILAEMRRAVREIDPNQPIVRLETMARSFAGAVATPRFMLLLVLVFAAAALVLAAIGVYGVVSYSVERRRREFAIRIAVGAPSRQVRALVLRQTLLLGFLGAGLGVAGVVMGGKLLESVLFGVVPADPIGVGGGALLLIVVALLATHAPAARATRVDPMEAIRVE
ncbi:MAG: FtsX-like permease family protein [Gemmatimonadales bacterium]|nr:FtsX-like permease family protein [Gemmatimonadales bacterium]